MGEAKRDLQKLQNEYASALKEGHQVAGHVGWYMNHLDGRRMEEGTVNGRREIRETLQKLQNEYASLAEGKA